MGAFEGAVLEQTVAVATKHKIEAAALLAVVTVESDGKSLEADGKTPCLLFERHVFYRELKKAGKTAQLSNAVAAGLAFQTWQPKTQYKDQGTSQKRLDLFRRASTIDPECAARSCSWGVGQTCGFLAEEIGFRNGLQMLNYMLVGGIPAQVECMVREIENKKLTSKLNAHNWAAFAKSYNGPGYAQNQYDRRMASAYTSWRRQTLLVPEPKPVEAPADVTPAALKPQSSSTPAVATAATAAGGSGLAYYAPHLTTSNIITIALIGCLVIIIAAVLWDRSKGAKPERGSLTFA